LERSIVVVAVVAVFGDVDVDVVYEVVDLRSY
jgi:hypothetical protein